MNPDPNPNPDPNNPNTLLETIILLGYNVRIGWRSVFTQFRVFPIFTSVDITVYQYGKSVLYFFYNIAGLWQMFRAFVLRCDWSILRILKWTKNMNDKVNV